MADAIFSPSWYRVAQLRPRIRSHGEVHRHVYRGEIWYVLEDHASGRYHRFTPEVNQIIGSMDGSLTISEIWDQAHEALGDNAPTQDEIIRLLGQLHSADLIQADVSPDTEELFNRFKQSKRKKLIQKITHPLAVKIPLFDPEKVLNAGLPFVKPLFSWFGFVFWLVTVLWAGLLAAENWTLLTENIVDRVLAPQNLLVIWIVYPVIKAIHEFGHAFATKVWGGQVHEMGVMLLVLVPVPYVDASSASAFSSRRRRMVVGAAGIMVELFLAALALFVWLSVEPGIVSGIAYSTMLIGGVSTLFFNGNPLLRFDGYYVMADMIEMPNLATRAKSYLGYLTKRYAFGVRSAKFYSNSRSERSWLLLYGVASFAYRYFILFVIVLFVAGRFFFIGVLLAAWAITTQMLLPLYKSLKFVFGSTELSRNRRRAVTVTGTFVFFLTILLLVPMPLRTEAEGVVWLPEQAHIRAGTDGFVVEVLAEDDSQVSVYEPLIRLRDPLLASELELLRARLGELNAQLAIQQFDDLSAAGVIRLEITTVQAQVKRTSEMVSELTVRAPVSGRFVVVSPEDMAGRFIRRGQLLGYVIDDSPTRVKVAVSQYEIGLVRDGINSVQVRPAYWGAAPVEALVQRAIPGGVNELPSAALGTAGGGRFSVDPSDKQAKKTIERVFQYDLELPEDFYTDYIGERVDVLFEHGSEPLLFQWYRSGRQLLLGQFGV